MNFWGLLIIAAGILLIYLGFTGKFRNVGANL